MKTPIEELMEMCLEKKRSLPDTMYANAAYWLYQDCYDMAKSMLDKEKDVMCKFAATCVRVNDFLGPDEVFEQTFNPTE